jgi:STE24 endopeptidase
VCFFLFSLLLAENILFGKRSAMLRFSRIFALFTLLAVLAPALALAQPAAAPTVDITKIPAAAQPSAHFDADAATEAYLNTIPPAARARSDAYFEGGYWLILWDFLVGAAIALILLETRLSAWMRTLAERISRFRWVQVLLYFFAYTVVTTVLGFPLSFYEEFLREHKYGLATQSFGLWMMDQLKTLAIGTILGGLFFLLLLALIRRLRRTWWIWGALATMACLVVVIALGPVYIWPLFNNVTRIDDPKVTQPILRLARENGIPATAIYQIDASRQSNRISANVSGFASTTRITLNDNLLRRSSPEEIQAVMGHEMGHYVMHHIPKGIVDESILAVLAFAFLYGALNFCLAHWGQRWGIREVSDPAVLPLAMLLVSTLFFVLTPVNNTLTRTQEKEADIFGLSAARQPDGFAQSALQLSEYRKMRPGKWEEILFFDHPSGYDRIHTAMVWKSQNLDLYPQPTTCPPPPNAATR